MTKLSDIDRAIFEKIHPVLSSKGAKLVGGILKGLLKTTINFDIDNDKIKELTVGGSEINIDIPSYFKDADSKILVFDDFERCSINVNDLLGYLNSLIEDKSLKVIIIANEEKINNNSPSTEAKQTDYSQIKEKLIGQIFDVETDILSAQNSFINSLSESPGKQHIINNSDTILKVYNESGYNNLRHLKQSVNDLHRFLSLLPDETFEKKDLTTHVINLFLCISIEVKSGKIDREKVSELLAYDLSFISADLPNEHNTIFNKYLILSLHNHPISELQLSSYFKYGTLNTEAVRLDFYNSQYYLDANTPAWRKLWFYDSYSDQEFDAIYKKSKQEFIDGKIDDPWALAQTFSTLLDISDKNLKRFKKSTILRIAKRNFELLFKQKKLTPLVETHKDYPGDATYGLAYTSKQLEEFEAFKDFAKKLIEVEKLNKLKSDVQELQQAFTSDIKKFIAEINVPYYGGTYGSFADTAILHLIKPTYFVKTLLNKPPSEQMSISYTIADRYNVSNCKSSLQEEETWIEDVIRLLHLESKKRDNKLSGYIIRVGIIKHFEEAVSKFKAAKQS